jgi:excisionase family DNA binding protein
VEINNQDILTGMFKEYPDVMNVKQVSVLLGVSTKTVYKLIQSGDFTSLKVGREFRVPKVSLMKYLRVFAPNAATQTT